MKTRIVFALFSLGCLAVGISSWFAPGPFSGDRYVYEGEKTMTLEEVRLFVAVHPGGITGIVEAIGESELLVSYRFESDEDFDLERRLNYEGILTAPILFGAVGLGFGFAAAVVRE